MIVHARLCDNCDNCDKVCPPGSGVTVNDAFNVWAKPSIRGIFTGRVCFACEELLRAMPEEELRVRATLAKLKS